ncbi:DUF123 domain-containing protein [Saliphagus sp. LR7]|uniref:GIY-YIG nuclease family protein n=1 Tax=Saliphagus sp. LR7 TaxID=2282654 RepID=UPI000DF7BE61|nr:GIY-YIG nuclease family protein [Saliphagus sp. LR7]
MARGTYVLAIDVPPIEVEIGAAGEYRLEGPYAYVGSAFGPGGFSRIERHRDLAAGEREVRHWHVDYLLGHPASELAAVARFPGADRECELAESLPGEPVGGVGASDCDCPAHLLSVPDVGRLREALESEGGVVG